MRNEARKGSPGWCGMPGTRLCDEWCWSGRSVSHWDSRHGASHFPLLTKSIFTSQWIYKCDADQMNGVRHHLSADIHRVTMLLHSQIYTPPPWKARPPQCVHSHTLQCAAQCLKTSVINNLARYFWVRVISWFLTWSSVSQSYSWPETWDRQHLSYADTLSPLQP